MTDSDKKSILLVEDDVFMLEILSEKLSKSGFDVNIAKDGEECIKVLESLKPDIILLDILMPKMDGIEVLRKVKVSLELSSIPVLVLSNLGQKEEVDRALGLGAKDYIVKSNFTTKEIVEKIKKVLSEVR